jgi:hypothetical protein
VGGGTIVVFPPPVTRRTAMHTIESLSAQSITDDRIRRATASRAAREAVRPSTRRSLKPRLHFRRPRHTTVPSV